MGLLDDVIFGAASDAVETSALLRQMQALAQQVGSPELRSWARAELTGYLAEHRLPTYRGPFVLPVGPDTDDTIEIEFRAPIAELAQIADLVGRRRAEEIGPADAVDRYRTRIAAGIDSRIALMRLCTESSVVPPPLLRSVGESVRNRVLEIALDLRAVAQDSGGPSGLSISSAALAFIVDGALDFGSGSAALGSSPAADPLLQDAAAAGLIEQMSVVLADVHRAEEAARVVLEDGTGAVKRNSVQRLATAVRAGRIPAAPGIHPDDAADRVLDIAVRHLGW